MLKIDYVAGFVGHIRIVVYFIYEEVHFSYRISLQIESKVVTEINKVLGLMECFYPDPIPQSIVLD